MSILRRARSQLPQEYLANGGIIKESYRGNGGAIINKLPSRLSALDDLISEDEFLGSPVAGGSNIAQVTGETNGSSSNTATTIGGLSGGIGGQNGEARVIRDRSNTVKGPQTIAETEGEQWVTQDPETGQWNVSISNDLQGRPSALDDLISDEEFLGLETGGQSIYAPYGSILGLDGTGYNLSNEYIDGLQIVYGEDGSKHIWDGNASIIPFSQYQQQLLDEAGTTLAGIGGTVDEEGVAPPGSYFITPTTDASGNTFNTIKYQQRPWNIDDFVSNFTSDTISETNLPGFNAPVIEPEGGGSEAGGGSADIGSASDANIVATAFQQETGIEVPPEVIEAAISIASDPTSSSYVEDFKKVFEWNKHNLENGITGQTFGISVDVDDIIENTSDWLPLIETTSATAANQGSSTPIITDDTSTLISQREGFSSVAYEDPPGSGKWSIGHGTQTYYDGSPVKQGDTITAEDALKLAEHHIEIATNAAMSNVSNFNSLSPELQTALVSHAYQLGGAGQAGFSKMIDAIERGDWETAIAEAENSAWATQTPKRLADLKAALLAEAEKTTVTTPSPPNNDDNDSGSFLDNLTNVGNLSGTSIENKTEIVSEATSNLSEEEKKGGAALDSALGISGLNRGGIIQRRQMGGILSHSQQQSQPTYRGILMNKLNRRKR